MFRIDASAAGCLEIAAGFDPPGRDLCLACLAEMGEFDKRMTRKTKTFDTYMAGLSPEKRAALGRLRKIIRAAAPKAEECISYGIPAFRLNGKFLVGFGAAATHCSFYPSAVLKSLGAELKGYDTSKGTIRFQPDDPLPRALVRKLVKTRIAKGGFGKTLPQLGSKT